jgi:hypothetical protein
MAKIIVHPTALPLAWQKLVRVTSDRRHEELLKKLGGRAK